MRTARLPYVVALLVAFAAIGFARADDKSHHNTTVTTPTVTPAPAPNITVESHPVTTSGASGGDASNSMNVEGDRALALATGAPIPAACPPGLMPGKGFKRGIGMVFGAWNMSGTCQAPTELERVAIDAQREHELELARVPLELEKAKADLLRAQAEADRAAAERMRAALECRDPCGK